MTHDVIVVGSGAAGAMAAQTLAERGRGVTVIDGGRRDDRYASVIPEADFDTIRRTDPDQHRYFLGDDYEGLGLADSRVGSQLTPPRAFLADGVDRLLPIAGESFRPLESLAYGGLGGGWGLGCYVYAEAELERMGLDPAAMLEAYRTVVDRIGVSGDPTDDAGPYTLRSVHDVQPPVALEPSLARLLRRYERRRAEFRGRDVVVGRSALALLTESKDGRAATGDQDMGFWSDAGRSAYRSWITMDRLREQNAVTYVGGCLVTRFAETDDGVRVEGIDVGSGEARTFSGRRLVLAGGVLGTARIVLRSLGHDGERLPILCNPYTYVPCLQPAQLGAAVPVRKTSFSPLVLHDDPGGGFMDAGVAALFTYRSLLLFKLVKEAPLNVADARRVLHYLQSAFVIAGVHHPDAGRPSRTLGLVAHDGPTGDALAVDFTLEPDEERANAARERRIAVSLRRLGCLPLKRIRTPPGASIHYGGTLPYDSRGSRMTLAADGSLAGTARVVVADGSGLRFLPARGPTLTLMANAHRVASAVARG